MGMMEDGSKDMLDVTSSGMKSSTRPQMEPVADLREAEGEINRRASTAVGRQGVVDVTSSERPGSDPRELEGEINRRASTAVGRQCVLDSTSCGISLRSGINNIMDRSSSMLLLMEGSSMDEYNKDGIFGISSIDDIDIDYNIFTQESLNRVDAYNNIIRCDMMDYSNSQLIDGYNNILDDIQGDVTNQINTDDNNEIIPINIDELTINEDGNGSVDVIEKEKEKKKSINLSIDSGDLKRQIVMDEQCLNNILKDLICPICLEYFYFPVTLLCGHTYCRYCIGHNKLTGKLCPLCRQPVGKILNINIILSNIVKLLKLRKRNIEKINNIPNISYITDKLWWDENCLKPFISITLFLRIIFNDILQSPIFFDDLCICIIDYFNNNNKWSKYKWVFTIDDYRTLRQLIGIDINNKEYTNIRLHNWVEDYLINTPQLCYRNELTYPIILKVFHDINHKIDGIIFNSLDIPNKLPWDAGRHIKSLLHLPHSSVSLSHLLFVYCNDNNNNIGILDVGSTIGTMIKLQGLYSLKNGDRIHIGDKHEIDITLFNDSIGTPFKDFKWNPITKSIIDFNEINNLNEQQQQQLHVLDSHLKLRIYADSQIERDVWICPKGVILGRGPITQSAYKKLSITTQNGYISREHCLIYYDGCKPKGERWLLRDTSTLGTFLKLKPFQEPLPISPGFVFKVGQCKIEITNANDNNRRLPSSATLIISQLLQSHINDYQSEQRSE